MTKTPEKIFSESQVIIANGVVVKNTSSLTDAEALTAKPWEVAPEGCKILSHNECIKHNNESHDGIMYYSNLSSAWKSAGYINAADTAVAVPADFTFAPIEPEIEVDGKMYKVSDLNKLIEAAKPIK